MNKLILVFTVLLLIGCMTVLKVTEIDSQTGYFPSKAKAIVIKKEKYDIDSMKSLILVTSGAFVEGQVKNIKYFDKVINLDKLSDIIVQEKLQAKVRTLADKIGINQAYINYKPFLWLRYDERKEDEKVYAQFILTDPKDLNDIFIAEKYLDTWAGINDQTTWYPLCNALIDYIRENSKIYR